MRAPVPANVARQASVAEYDIGRERFQFGVEQQVVLAAMRRFPLMTAWRPVSSKVYGMPRWVNRNSRRFLFEGGVTRTPADALEIRERIDLRSALRGRGAQRANLESTVESHFHRGLRRPRRAARRDPAASAAEPSESLASSF